MHEGSRRAQVLGHGADRKVNKNLTCRGERNLCQKKNIEGVGHGHRNPDKPIPPICSAIAYVWSLEPHQHWFRAAPCLVK